MQQDKQHLNIQSPNSSSSDEQYHRLPKQHQSQINPFMKSFKKADHLKKLKGTEKSKIQNSVKALENQDQLQNVGPQDIGNLLSQHLPQNSNEYLEQISIKIDTNDLLQIVQVFSHQQNRLGQNSIKNIDIQINGKEQKNVASSNQNGLNDYVLVVLKINSPELKNFYSGAEYLFQIWRNKKRLFQHVHNYQIKSYFLNKTELVYTLDMPKKNSQFPKNDLECPFDSNLNFIYAIQPFTQTFARILFPFQEEICQDKKDLLYLKNQQVGQIKPVIFINDEHLIVAQKSYIKYIHTDQFFDQTNKLESTQDFQSVFTAGKKKDKNQSEKLRKYYDPINNDEQKQEPKSLNILKGKMNQNDNEQKFLDEQFDEAQNINEDGQIKDRRKTVAKNQSLYDIDEYENGIVQPIKCQTIYGFDFNSSNILCIDQFQNPQKSKCPKQQEQKFTKIGGTSIFVFVAEESGKISIHKLNLDGKEETKLQNEKSKLNNEEIKSDLKIQNMKNMHVDKNIGSSTFTEMKIVNISEKYTISILKNTENKVYFIHNILDPQNRRFQDFQQELIFQDFIIKQFEFGQKKIHFQLQKNNEEVCHCMSLNEKDQKFEIQTFQKYKDIISSMLDEEFMHQNVQIYDDMNLLGGVLLLSHGQCVSIYNQQKCRWSHYFNMKNCKLSNIKTLIVQSQAIQYDYKQVLQEINEEETFEFDRLIKEELNLKQNVSFNPLYLKKHFFFEKPQQQNQSLLYSEQCFFNRKKYEIQNVLFLHQQNENTFEFLINQQGGQVIKVQVIFLKSLQNKIQQSKQQRMLENDPLIDEFLEFLDQYCEQNPQFSCKKLTSDCERLQNRDVNYFTLDLFQQVNYGLFKDFGIFEQRIYMNTLIQDEPGRDYYVQDLFMYQDNDQNVQFKNFINVDAFRQYHIIPVHNSKTDHLFVYNQEKQSLHIIKTENQFEDIQQVLSKISFLLQTNQICEIQQFEYVQGKQYFIEQESFFFSLKGDLCEINIQNGQRKIYNFDKMLIDNKYFILPGKHLFFKAKTNYLYFVDLEWVHSSDHAESQSQNQVFLKSKFKIMPSQSCIYSKIDYDPINNDIISFTSPSTICILPDIGQYKRVCRGSVNYPSRFLATNIDRNDLKIQQIHKMINNLDQHDKKSLEIAIKVKKDNVFDKYMCPSEHLAKICSYDIQNHSINVWDIGSGKLTVNKLEGTSEYNGYKKHNEWNGFTLLTIDQPSLKKHYGVDVEKLSNNYQINSSNGFKWKKVQVDQNSIQTVAEFYLDFKKGSKIYLSQNNDILLEFIEDYFNYYIIDNTKIKKLKNQEYQEKKISMELYTETLFKTKCYEEQKMEFVTDCPVYFSKDFKKYIKIDQNEIKINQKQNTSISKDQQQYLNEVQKQQQKLHIYELNLQNKKYEVNKFVYLPLWSNIKKNEKGLPYIYFQSIDKISYIDINNVEQVIPLNSDQNQQNFVIDKILGNQRVIGEKYLPKDKLEFRTFFDSLNFSESQIVKLNNLQVLKFKSIQIQELNIDIKQILDFIDLNQYQVENYSVALYQSEAENLLNTLGCFNYNMITYSQNNLRYLQSFSFYTWKIIEAIIQDEITIDQLSSAQISELLRVILPDGQTLTNLLALNRNLKNLEKLNEKIKFCSPSISFELIPNIRGMTALHECVKQTQTKAAEGILRILGQSPLNNHFQMIQDILGDLVESCPMAVSKYFNDRMIECPWTMKHSKGDIKLADKDLDFCFYSNPLIQVSQANLEDKLFVKDSQAEDKLNKDALQKSKQQVSQNKIDQKHLPMVIKVFDFPKLHHFHNKHGQAFMSGLCESDPIIFDQVYIQTFLEYQWPAAKHVILKMLFIPYIFFLLFFNYYAIFYFEKVNSEQKTIQVKGEGYIIRSILISFSLYFLHNEYWQLRNCATVWSYFSSFWNYIDLIPIFMVFTAIFISFLSAIQKEKEFLQVERYVNAVASFFIWFKLLYFFRVFRVYGHLIKTIVQVLIDMKVFVVILFMSLLAFSGTFFILAQNNEGDDIFVKTYIQSLMQTFQLMLGDFDSDKFGKVGFPIVYFVFAIAAVFLIVIMLNILIAIISDTFENVQSQQKRMMYKEFAQLILENYHLLQENQKTKFDNQGNYLFISKIQQGNGNSESQEYEGQRSGDSSAKIDGVSAANNQINALQLKTIEQIVQQKTNQIYKDLQMELNQFNQSNRFSEY